MLAWWVNETDSKCNSNGIVSGLRCSQDSKWHIVSLCGFTTREGWDQGGEELMIGKEKNHEKSVRTEDTRMPKSQCIDPKEGLKHCADTLSFPMRLLASSVWSSVCLECMCLLCFTSCFVILETLPRALSLLSKCLPWIWTLGLNWSLSL